MTADLLKSYGIFGLGFAAQALFGLRVLVQWRTSERARQVASPALFWNLSLTASALFLLYGLLRLDVVIILGQTIGYFIYIRNLQLKNYWIMYPVILKLALLVFPVVAIAWTLVIAPDSVSLHDNFWQNRNAFLWAGIIGQLLLNARFVVQLYISEKQKTSVLPAAFWWISLAGALLVIAYAVYKLDPVLLLAQGISIIPYTRNIILSKKATEDAAE
jgi:lipid-A-disaccharide synthase-like uncharacterized protein